jgi:hypothetical protein
VYAYYPDHMANLIERVFGAKGSKHADGVAALRFFPPAAGAAPEVRKLEADLLAETLGILSHGPTPDVRRRATALWGAPKGSWQLVPKVGADFMNMVQVGPLRGLAGLSVFKGIVVGLPHTVNVLLCGEDHRNDASGNELMFYAYGQALLGKCVDLYVEDDFPWAAVKTKATGKGASGHLGGGGLRTIRTSYESIPSLRVHRIDTRGGLKYGRKPGERPTPDEWNTPFFTPDYFTHSTIPNEIRGKRLFRFSPSEVVTFMFGPGLVEGGRTLEQLVARYKSDHAKMDEDTRPLLQPESSFRIRRDRSVKQMRRFASQHGQETMDKVRAATARRLAYWRLRSDPAHPTFEAATLCTDLFTFFRMFATFTERDNGKGYEGCPLEQRNIIYYCGDYHRRNVVSLIQHVFGACPEAFSVECEGPCAGTSNNEIGLIPPFELF